MRKHGWMTNVGRFFRSTTGVVVLTFTALGAPLFVYAHNLQTKLVYMFFDPNTQAMLDARVAGRLPSRPAAAESATSSASSSRSCPATAPPPAWAGTSTSTCPTASRCSTRPICCPATACRRHHRLRQGADEGAVADRRWRRPHRRQGHCRAGDPGRDLHQHQRCHRAPVGAGTGLHRGTIAGVYGDTGIFYSTDPDTAYGSWQRYTGAAGTQQVCGLVGTPGLTAGKTITNNSGDVFIPCNKWDAEQMFAWGVKGTTCATTGCTATPIVDPRRPRQHPWGFGSGVAGPQSGYEWHFDWDA